MDVLMRSRAADGSPSPLLPCGSKHPGLANPYEKLVAAFNLQPRSRSTSALRTRLRYHRSMTPIQPRAFNRFAVVSHLLSRAADRFGPRADRAPGRIGGGISPRSESGYWVIFRLAK